MKIQEKKLLIFEKYWNEFWDDTYGALTETLNRIAKSAAEKSLTAAEAAVQIAEEFEYFSERAKEVGQRAIDLGIEGKEKARAAMDSIAREFSKHADSIRSEGVSGWADANKFLKEYAEHALMKSVAEKAGPLGDFLDILENLKEGDYYGALSSFIGALAGLAWMARYASGWGVVGAVLLAYGADKGWKNIFETLGSTNISERVADLYMRAYNFRPRCEPLVFDLDGDGIETLTANGEVMFDHDADGIKHATGWINSDDGLLALDKDGDGLITSGRELFGDQTLLGDGSRAKNGYEALAQYDSNSDGVIDNRDAIFNDLRIWRDFNADGISDSGELLTLAEAGIKDIQLAATERNSVIPGAKVIAEGTYTKTDNSTGKTAALDFDHNPFFQQLPDVDPGSHAQLLAA